MRATVAVRDAERHDVAAVAAIYAHYVRTSAATFDLDEPSVAEWERRFEQQVQAGPYHLLVATDGGAVVGWCETTPFRERRAYQTSCSVSIYCAPDARGRGVGTSLYAELFARLDGAPFHRAYALITQPNEASMTLHERFGFTRCGVLTEVGRKFDRWWDVAWLEKPLT